MNPINNNRFFRVVTVAALLSTINTAQAMSTQTAPANWRFNSSTQFNGVNFDGVARLSFDNDGDLNNGNYICSGTLLSGGQYVLTAAHCADDFNIMQIDFGVNNNIATATRSVSATYIHSGWSGALDRGADIAILKLDQIISGITGFNLHNASALGGSVLMMGYGTTNTGGSTSAPNWSEYGHGHWGVNTYDVTGLNFLTAADGLNGVAVPPVTYGVEYVADFDNGTSTNNTLERVAALTGNQWSSGLGVENEAMITGGDSGGGDFFWDGSEWLLTGVHSWGWQFCGGRISPSCDYSNLNSGSYGDLMGSTAVYSHIDWLDSIINPNHVPEPASLPLLAAGLFAALGLGRRKKSS